MLKHIPPSLLMVAAGLACTSAWSQDAGRAADPLPIRAITLYRSGVASFERRGVIDGDAAVQLRFSTEQVNDILKSMVVLDLSGNGRIDGVSYVSRDPLSKRLSSFGIDLSDEPTLGALMTRLRGAKVTMTMPEGPWTGTVVGCENRAETKGQGQPVQVPYVNILTAAGIKSLNLTQASSVDLQDKELAAELQKALSAVAEHRADRTKTVDISLSGQGSREIVVGYVQESPVWKASYRLVLPDEAGPPGKGEQVTLQGWAIVENTTDEDWSGVVLSLVSGRPVSFRMDLYEPLYVARPQVPVPTVPGVASRIFEGGVALKAGLADIAEGRLHDPSEKYKKVEADRAGVTERLRSGAPVIAGGGPGGYRTADAGELAQYAASSQAKAVESGEVFEYQLDHPVTIERQRSAMLPIISGAVTGRRVSIFSSTDPGLYPMRGIEMTNSTKLELLPGPISVYDHGTYAGDAQIGHVPAGDKRLLAYSVDLAVTHVGQTSGEQHIQKVRIVKGALEATYLRREGVKHTFTNKDAQRGRDMVIEEPRREGWELKTPEKPYETTEGLYRFLLPLEKAKTGSVDVAFERVEAHTYAVTSVELATLLSYRQSGGKVSDKVVDAFKEVQKRQALVEDSRKGIEALEKEKTTIDADQGRIRSNMNTIDGKSDLYRRYMQKLTDQEARLEAIATELEKARKELQSREESLAAFVAGLDVE
ncbi:MAG: hypothetical protein JSR77_07775 [Planctomycetes bacterium]|nr:hypothetical protein [Planctomycetota bacterium]